MERELIRTAHACPGGEVRVTFALPADDPAGAVSVVGDFIGWDPFAHPLRRRSNGTRSAVVRLAAGSRSRFRYLADGGRRFDDESGASLAI
jgi:1,4-alpha-glucan branching enzyme